MCTKSGQDCTPNTAKQTFSLCNKHAFSYENMKRGKRRHNDHEIAFMCMIIIWKVRIKSPKTFCSLWNTFTTCGKHFSWIQTFCRSLCNLYWHISHTAKTDIPQIIIHQILFLVNIAQTHQNTMCTKNVQHWTLNAQIQALAHCNKHTFTSENQKKEENWQKNHETACIDIIIRQKTRIKRWKYIAPEKILVTIHGRRIQLNLIIL